MSLLYKHLRIHQVFGANTDVGKTIITSALVRAAASRERVVHYLKPVSTGPIRDADDEHVLRYGGPHKQHIKPHCLFRYQDPVSPHLAATRESDHNSIPSDQTFVTALAHHIRKCASKQDKATMYLETAGGVHSPTLSGTTQLDAYRPLFLPTILIGDSRLGGISSTISAFESLQMRGYNVDALLLFSEEYYRNFEYLTDYFKPRGVHVASLPGPPPRLENEQENFERTEEYYASLVPSTSSGPLTDITDHLDACHSRRIEELDSMPRRTLDTVWWPFVQHGAVKSESDITVIDSAHGDFFSVHRPSPPMEDTITSKTSSMPLDQSNPSLLFPQLDGSASWWTQTFGHSNSRLTMAAARAAGRYGHIMFPQASHLPALKLSERMVREGPGRGWAARAFISDNGSTGMEIALKMALRTYAVTHGLKGVSPQEKRQFGVLGLQGSYHGDTIGAMNASDAGDGVYTCEWHDSKGYWLDPPTISIQHGKQVVTLPSWLPALDAQDTQLDMHQAYNVEERLQSPLAEMYRTRITESLARVDVAKSRIAALVLEPLLLGAGGMRFVDPLFQRILIDVARGTHRIPVVFDEVFTGLYRIGFERGADVLGVFPDISVNAKVLTGGLVPLAVTLATDKVFRAFWSEDKGDALLHGHSYSAYVVGCEVANETLAMIEELKTSPTWDAARRRWQKDPESISGTLSVPSWSMWDPDFVKALSKNQGIHEVMTLGSVLALKTKSTGGYRSNSAQELFKGLRTDSTESANFTAAPGGLPFGIHYRTLGDVAYFMLSLNTHAETIRDIEDKIWNVVQAAH